VGPQPLKRWEKAGMVLACIAGMDPEFAAPISPGPPQPSDSTDSTNTTEGQGPPLGPNKGGGLVPYGGSPEVPNGAAGGAAYGAGVGQCITNVFYGVAKVMSGRENMTTSPAVMRDTWNRGVWWAFPLHQILSTVGVLALAGLLTFIVSPLPRARWILTETPYFPVQIALAFLIGLVLPRFLRHWLMQWVWVLPFLILCVSFVLTPLPLVDRFEHYFGWGCRPELGCFVQLAVTLPFYAAAAYALAAFLRSTIQRQREQHETAR